MPVYCKNTPKHINTLSVQSCFYVNACVAYIYHCALCHVPPFLYKAVSV
jgi:hypothetical protein